MFYNNELPLTLIQFRDIVLDKFRDTDSYIVGGTVRDILNNSNKFTDVDIVLSISPFKVAKIFANLIGGSYVRLNNNFQTARVVKKITTDEELSFDFTMLNGRSIYEDLKNRDFTINAMAIPLSGNFENTIDVFDGQRDLQNKVIKMVDECNLARDPLRVLRAFRFQSKLSFNIEKDTMTAIKKLKELIKGVSAERVFYELKEMFNAKRLFPAFKNMVDSGVFFELFPEINIEFEKNHDISIEKLFLSFRTLEEVIQNNILPFSQQIKDYLNTSKYKNGLLKIAFSISYAISLEKESVFRKTYEPLKMSRKEEEFFLRLFQTKREVLSVISNLNNKEAIVRLLEKTKEDIFGVILSTYASIAPFSSNKDILIDQLTRIVSFYEHTYRAYENRLMPVTGNDLQLHFGLSPSPVFRKILDTVRIKTIAGAIKTKEESFNEVEKLLTKVTNE